MNYCEACKYYKPKTTQAGVCTMNPPLSIVVGNRIQWGQPEVYLDDNCSHWLAREQPKETKRKPRAKKNNG